MRYRSTIHGAPVKVHSRPDPHGRIRYRYTDRHGKARTHAMDPEVFHARFRPAAY